MVILVGLGISRDFDVGRDSLVVYGDAVGRVSFAYGVFETRAVGERGNGLDAAFSEAGHSDDGGSAFLEGECDDFSGGGGELVDEDDEGIFFQFSDAFGDKGFVLKCGVFALDGDLAFGEEVA